MRYSRIPFHAATLWSSLVCLAAGGGVGGGGASIPLSPQEEEERGDGDGDGRRRLHRGGEGEKKRSRSDFLVTGLDEVVPAYAEFDGEMYAGLLPMDNNSKGHRQRRSGELMFWLFEPSKPAVDDSVVMWLNGGPGCSSFTAGVMMENSPVMVKPRPAGYCCLSPNEPLEYNGHAWTKATAMLYLEQPVGVGFSSGGPEPQDEDDVAGDVYAFLLNFYDAFPEYLDKKLYVIGESYAGYYAPSIARKVHEETLRYRRGDTEGRVDVQVGGLALGNGWADAHIQGPATIDYAYWHGMIDSTTRDALHNEWERCMTNDKALEEPFHPFTTPDDCAMMEGALMAAGAGVVSANDIAGLEFGPNAYDVTTWDSYDALLWGNNSIVRFFNDPRVKEKLHAPQDVVWQGCIPGAGRRRRRLVEDESSSSRGHRGLLLDHDQPVSTVPYMAELLDDGVPVLIYNGDRDLTTNAQGSEMLLDGMRWKGASGWRNAERGLWVVQKEGIEKRTVAGYTKEHQGLSFVVVYNSGHLVPFNVPEESLDLITRFLKNETFKDYALPSFAPKKGTKTKGLAAAATDEYPNRNPHHRSSGLVSVLVAIVALVASFAAGYYASSQKHRGGYEKISSGVELE